MNAIKYLISVFLLFPVIIHAQSLVKGTVYQAQNEQPVKAVQITIKPLHKVLTTDETGTFATKLPAGTYSFIFSKPGFITQTIKKVIHQEPEIVLMPIYLQPVPETLNPIILSGITDFVADNKKPLATTNLSKISLRNMAAAKDLPEMLNEIPSVYATKKGGGIGDSRINIRGFSQRNIAVLINGVPVNDMQTGWVYWSNWLNLPEISNNVQLQPGMGASKLAVPSVGGTLNILTQSAGKTKGGAISYTFNSFGLHKISAIYNTGLLDNGLSASMEIGRIKGKGYIDMTDVDAYTYYFNLAYMSPGQKHQIMFNVIGAPQWHYQRNKAPKLSDFLQYGPNNQPDIRYNSEWGYLKGKAYSWSKNYFHKPVFSLNWDWYFKEKWQLSSVLYGMFGKGGGTGPIGAIHYHYPNDPVYTNQEGQIRFDDIYTWNSGGHVPDFGPDRNPDANGMYVNKIDEGLTRYAFMNNHAWYGGMFNLKYKANTHFSALAGLDIRTTSGKNTLTVNDVLGADAYFDNFDVNKPGQLITPEDFVPATYDWNPFTSIDKLKKIVFFNQANINWLGMYGQMNYQKGNWTQFLQAGISNQGFQRIDYFHLPEGKQKSPWVNIYGGNIKAGIGYQPKSSIYTYINGGFFSKQPLFNAVFPNGSDNKIAKDLKNEKIYNVETGIRFKKSQWYGSLNLYYTLWKDRYETVSDYVNNQQVSGILKNIQEVHQGIEWTGTAKFKKWQLYNMISIGNWYYRGNVKNVTLYNFQQQPVSVKDYYLDNVKVGNAAQFTAALKLRYKITKGLHVYASQQYFDNLYAKIDVGSFSNPHHQGSLKLPAYSIVNTGLTYRVKYKNTYKITLRVGIDNLMNKKYISESETNIFAQPGAETWQGIDLQNRVFFGWGRTWHVALKVHL